MPEGGSGVPAGSPSDPLSPRCCCSGAARVPLALLPACAPVWLLQPLATCREPSSSSSSSGGRRNESHEGLWGALGSVTLSTHLPHFCLTQPQLLPEVLPGTHRAPQGGVPSPVPPPKRSSRSSRGSRSRGARPAWPRAAWGWLLRAERGWGVPAIPTGPGCAAGSCPPVLSFHLPTP